MNKKELDRVLEQHRLWLESGGNKGERADLQGANLRHVSLQNVDLRYANLWNVDLRYANLRNANLRGANLLHINLQDADLRHAKFDTNIRDCWSFRLAKFIQDALPWLILHPKWAEWKDTVQIEGA